jgi:hypothetical protein
VDRTRPRAFLLLALIGALVVGAGVLGTSTPASAVVGRAPVPCQAQAGATPQAGSSLAVVVDFGGGRVRTRCTEAGGSGVDVLRRAGFAPVTQTYGSEGGAAAICALKDPDTGTLQGCQSGSSCLTCLAPDSWGYFPAYRYSQVGAGLTRPGAGTVEAWRWGRSTSWGGGRPSVADVCEEPAPEPPPSTAPPATNPPGGGGGGGGSATPIPVDPGGSGGSGGGGQPGGGSGGSGSGGPGGGATPGGGDPTTPAPGATSTTAPADGATTTAPADGSSTTEADGSSGT